MVKERVVITNYLFTITDKVSITTNANQLIAIEPLN